MTGIKTGARGVPPLATVEVAAERRLITIKFIESTGFFALTRSLQAGTHALQSVDRKNFLLNLS